MRTYNPRSGLSSLTVIPISQASAIQRAGRAGRTSNGVCYRLYTYEAYNQLGHVTAPEILRTDLTSPIVQLKALGIDNLMKLEWLTIPPSESIVRCLSGLIADGIIGTDGHLTPVGLKVAEVPMEVRLASMVCLSDRNVTPAEFSANVALAFCRLSMRR
jgi:ATP-dependent RNA helicase DDX35